MKLKYFKKRLKELAYLNKKLSIELFDNRKSKPAKFEYKFDKGLEGFVLDLNKKRETKK